MTGLEWRAKDRAESDAGVASLMLTDCIDDLAECEKERDERLAEMNLQARWTNEWRARAERAESTLSRLREGARGRLELLFDAVDNGSYHWPSEKKVILDRILSSIFDEPKEAT
jgi:hypothetical protein